MRLVQWGDPDAPAAVVAHGAGSTAAFVGRVFAAPLSAVGYRLVSWDCRAADPVPELAAAVDACGARLVGGISLGAHAAVRWAAAGGAAPAGLVVALVGWTGRPAATAQLTAAAAEEIDRDGLPEVVRRLRRDAPGWVAAELADAWSQWPQQRLVEVLRATGRSWGPTAEELARVAGPVGIATLAGDPYHPDRAAAEWARLLPAGAVEVVRLEAPAADRSALGHAAVRAWQRAGGRAAGVSGPR